MPITAQRLIPRSWRIVGALLLATATFIPVPPARGSDSPSPSTNATPTSSSWRPFAPVIRPAIPSVPPASATHSASPSTRQRAANPIDAFVEEQLRRHQLTPRPEASREVLLRRVSLDLIGLLPTPEEQEAFLSDRSPEAYERLVDRLLQDPRHGERWARHWMDVWRYSDWAGWAGGNQIRDSQPHIWRWRDWIVESVNTDKGYDRMVLEMLAADEFAPDDTDALRATGFLVRNYKMLSREQWIEDTLKHTSQAFLGMTVGCAKCHDHRTDPISQEEYYRLRAVFDPHQVRIDRIPGQLDTAKDGLARVYDSGSNSPTYFLTRGDERRPDTNRVMMPGVPAFLGGRFEPQPVPLSRAASHPDHREFVIRDLIAAAEREIETARGAVGRLSTNTPPASSEDRSQADLQLALASARLESLVATVAAERAESEPGRDSPDWQRTATQAVSAQRRLAVAEARLALEKARATAAKAQAKADAAKDAEREKLSKEAIAAKDKTAAAGKALADAEAVLAKEPDTAYVARAAARFPETSSGRRLALARWLTDRGNPLTARVAANHVWLRHFGRGLVPNPADFGRSAQTPSHPELIDWLAAELMDHGWSLKHLHRLMVTSQAYRRASTSEPTALAADPDNLLLWRMNPRRMEAELVRDNELHAAGSLDLTVGGPEVDHQQGLTSRRRSLYLRLAAEKDVEFLRIFDGPSVTECYERRPTVVPQQALALANSELSLREARNLAARLATDANPPTDDFIDAAFRRVLSRPPTSEETRFCREFLETPAARSAPARARENLALVLFNHNEFVTIR